MHNFKELNVWKKARAFIKEVYLLAGNFPKEEKFGLASQVQRAVISIPSNIAEGAGRVSPKEFHYFLNIAVASSFEVETQLILAFDLAYISEDTLNSALHNVQEIQKMLAGLMKSIKYLLLDTFYLLLS